MEEFNCKQNRESTEGCSKYIVRKNHDKFGKKIGLNKQKICKSKMGRDQVSGGVSSILFFRNDYLLITLNAVDNKECNICGVTEYTEHLFF